MDFRFPSAKQISYLASLAKTNGYRNIFHAKSAYGVGLGDHDMNSSDASDMIDWMKSGEAAQWLAAHPED